MVLLYTILYNIQFSTCSIILLLLLYCTYHLTAMSLLYSCLSSIKLLNKGQSGINKKKMKDVKVFISVCIVWFWLSRRTVEYRYQIYNQTHHCNVYSPQLMLITRQYEESPKDTYYLRNILPMKKNKLNWHGCVSVWRKRESSFISIVIIYWNMRKNSVSLRETLPRLGSKVIGAVRMSARGQRS